MEWRSDLEMWQKTAASLHMAAFKDRPSASVSFLEKIMTQGLKLLLSIFLSSVKVSA